MHPNQFTRLVSHAQKARSTGLLAVLGTGGPASGLADMGALQVSGADAAAFLHSQLTNEVKALKAGEGNLSARATRTGTLLRYFSLHALPAPYPAGFLLLLEREGIASLRADLEKFAISDDAQFADVSAAFDWIALQGPAAPAVAETTFGKIGEDAWADLPAYSVRALPAGVLCFTRSLTGDAGFVLAVPKESGDFSEILARLESAARAKVMLVLDGGELNGTLEILRIEAGIVRIGPDAVEGKLVLPETGLEQFLVSYTKGCYLGQEVIARIRTYGSLPHVLRGLVFDGVKLSDIGACTSLLENIPECGAEIILEDGKAAGRIASRTLSTVLEAPIAFAYLDRVQRTPGTLLKLRARDGTILTTRVTLLPFYHAADVKARAVFLHDRAIRLFADGQDERSVEMLVEALRLDSSFADAYEALGVIMGRSGRFAEAIDIFKRLEEVAPNEPMVHTNLSLFYMKLGDKQAAEGEKAKATVKQFSRFGAAHRDQKRVAEEEEKKKADAERKKRMFEEVLEIDPEDPIALFGLGNALSNLTDWAAAERALAKACAAQKDNSAAYLAHGKTLEMLNRETDAVAVYKAGMVVASRKGDLMPLKEMERRVLLLSKQ